MFKFLVWGESVPLSYPADVGFKEFEDLKVQVWGSACTHPEVRIRCVEVGKCITFGTEVCGIRVCVT